MKKHLVLVLSVIAFLFTAGVYAIDVPLSTAHIVDDAIDEPQSVFAADIDNDGALDLVAAATAANTIAWWRNANGDGTVWTLTTIDDAFPAAEEVHAADVDGDGDLDVLGAAGDVIMGEIAWWENVDGDGTTWSKITVAPLSRAFSVRGADLDQDGDVDILGTNYLGSDILWWENDSGDGATWTSHTITTDAFGARFARTADVDHDGDPDVLAVALEDDFIGWWENGGGAATWTRRPLHTTFDQARAVHATDLDGDGDLDILGAAQAEDRIAWWENVGGDFSSHVEHTVTASFAGVRAIDTIDLDQDGDEDIVGAAFTANEITWWENSSGDASTWSEHTIDNAFGDAISVHVADVDGDGDEDILGAAELDDTIAWWENETIHSSVRYPAQFTHTITDTLDRSVWSETADMDRDGDLDVLATGHDAHSISWFENTNGEGSTWDSHLVYRSYPDDPPPSFIPYMIHSADFDRDGDLDLAAIDFGRFGISWFENVDGYGASWITRTLPSASHFDQFAVADLDSDGDDDLVASNRALYWWENQNNGSTWVTHDFFAPYNHDNVRPIAVADVDNDGDADVMTGAGQNDTVYVWENTDGVGLTWNTRELDTEFDGPSYLEPADLDEDGDIDILGTAYLSDEVVWWENDGDGVVWTKHIIDGAFDMPDTVRAFDIDQDGDLDALVTSIGPDAVDEFAWWENTAGDASTWTKHLLAYGDNATSIDAADLDGDGDLDIVGAAWNDNNVLWWQNMGGQFTLDTTVTTPPTLNAGSQDDVLQIVAAHNGRSGDNDAELTTFELLLEETGGDPLSDAEANAIIANLHIYLDDGSGTFEAGNDTLVTTVNDLALSNGVQIVPFTDDDPNVQLSHGAPRTYFVVVELAPDLATNPDRNDVNTLRLTHITEDSSTAQDRLHNIPLSLAYAANVAGELELRGPTAVMLLDVNVERPGASPWPIGLVIGILLLVGLHYRTRSEEGN